MAGSHSVYVSHPEATADLIKQAGMEGSQKAYVDAQNWGTNQIPNPLLDPAIMIEIPAGDERLAAFVSDWEGGGNPRARLGV